MISIIKNQVRAFKKASKRLFNPLPFTPPVFKGKDFGFSRGTPVDRVYIDCFLQLNCQYIKGAVLEFGDDHYYRKFCKDNNSNCEIFTSEIDNRINDVKRIYGDLTRLDDQVLEKYDTIICTNVLNFIYDINSAVIGLHKLLKTGGTCLITLASYSTHISKYDNDRWGDYWRFSEKSAKTIFQNLFSIKESCVFGNSYASVAQMYGYCVEDLEIKKIFVTEDEYVMLVCLILKKE